MIDVSNFSCLMWIQFFLHHLLKMLSFLQCVCVFFSFFPHLSNNKIAVGMLFILDLMFYSIVLNVMLLYHIACITVAL